MTRGTVDRATAIMVPAIFTFRSPADAFGWAQDSAFAFTLIGLLSSTIKFPSNPTPDGSTSGYMGELMAAIGGRFPVDKPKPRALAAARATAAARDFAGDTRRLRHVLQLVKADRDYEAWLVWNAQHELIEHATRLSGLFDVAFLDEIAAAINLSKADCRHLSDLSGDLGYVRGLGARVVGGQATSTDLEVVECWLAAIVLRGLYHDEFARVHRRHHVRHPIRQFANAATDPGTTVRTFGATTAEHYFAGIVLGASFAATRSPSERIKLYATNLFAARSARASGQLLLGGSDMTMTHETGLDRAVREAQTLFRSGVLDVGASRSASAIDFALGLPTQLLGFVLTPWVGAFSGVASSAAQETASPGQRVVRHYRSSRRRLEDLAKATPGAVDIHGRRRRKESGQVRRR